MLCLAAASLYSLPSRPVSRLFFAFQSLVSFEDYRLVILFPPDYFQVVCLQQECHRRDLCFFLCTLTGEARFQFVPSLKGLSLLILVSLGFSSYGIFLFSFVTKKLFYD